MADDKNPESYPQKQAVPHSALRIPHLFHSALRSPHSYGFFSISCKTLSSLSFTGIALILMTL
jgi:hypothetical protein